MKTIRTKLEELQIEATVTGLYRYNEVVVGQCCVAKKNESGEVKLDEVQWAQAVPGVPAEDMQKLIDEALR